MRAEDLSQPAGGPLLTEMLNAAQYTLEGTQFSGLYYYKMDYGHVNEHAVDMNEGINKTSLHQPSYNLVIYYNRVPIFAAYYELDKRFSMEMSEEESERVEDYLANETIGLLTFRGLLWFLVSRLQSSMLFSIIRKESDDKKFLSLN